MIIASLNTRGNKSIAKRTKLRHFVTNLPEKLDILAIQEANLSKEDLLPNEFPYQNLWFQLTGWLILNKNITITSSKAIDEQGRLSEIRISLNNSEYKLLNVYIPAKKQERIEFIRNQLLQIEENYDYVLGDFNTLLEPLLDRYPPRSKNDEDTILLQTWLETHNFEDTIPLNQKSKFASFTRHNQNISFTRIDYIFRSINQSNTILNHCTYAVPFTDHRIIVLKTNTSQINKNKKRTNLKMISRIMEKKEWQQEIKNILKMLKYKKISFQIFKQLALKISVRLDKKHKELKLKELKSIQNQINHLSKNAKAQPSEQWIEKFTSLNKKLNILTEVNIANSIITAKEKWLNQGESITGLLPTRMKPKSTASRLTYINNQDGTQNHSETAIALSLSRFYSKLYNEEPSIEESKSSLLENYIRREPEKKLTSLEKALLDAPILENEVYNAIKSAPKNKTPGPDGISYEFYQQIISSITKPLTEIFNKAIKSKNIEGFNITNVALLYKNKGNKGDLKYWRPINLANTDGKILSRIMVTRIKPIIKRIITKTQYGFTPERYIWENVSIINNMLKLGKYNVSNGYAIFLDQEKAYDRVSWTYLNSLLEILNFPKSFINWIKSYQIDQTFAFITNFHPFPICNIKRGLRQGDPISPMLFNISLDPFISTINNRLNGIPIMNTNNIKSLAFADDVVIFVNSELDITKMKLIIKQYSEASNAKVNQDKTEWLEVGNPTFNLPKGIIPQKNPIRHLGFWLSKNGIETNFTWNLLMSKMVKISNIIKSTGMSIIGKTAAVNSFLLSIPMYWSHLILYPKKYMDQLEKLVQKTLWYPGRPNKKLEKLNAKPIEGGLGLLNFNETYQLNFCKTLVKIFDSPLSKTQDWKKTTISLLSKIYKCPKDENHESILRKISNQLPIGRKKTNEWIHTISQLKKENVSIIINNQKNPNYIFLYKNLPLDKTFRKPKNIRHIIQLPNDSIQIPNGNPWKIIMTTKSPPKYRSLDDNKIKCPWGCGINPANPIHKYIQCPRIKEYWIEVIRLTKKAENPNQPRFILDPNQNLDMPSINQIEFSKALINIHQTLILSYSKKNYKPKITPQDAHKALKQYEIINRNELVL
jgi:hypothetical protein